MQNAKSKRGEGDVGLENSSHRGVGGGERGRCGNPHPRRAAQAPDAPLQLMHSGELETGIHPLPTAPDFAGQTGDGGARPSLGGGV